MMISRMIVSLMKAAGSRQPHMNTGVPTGPPTNLQNNCSPRLADGIQLSVFRSEGFDNAVGWSHLHKGSVPNRPFSQFGGSNPPPPKVRNPGPGFAGLMGNVSSRIPHRTPSPASVSWFGNARF